MKTVPQSKRDHQLRTALLREWNRFVRRLPAAARLAWLESARGLVAHGARQRKSLVAELRALRRRLEARCASEAWIEARWHGGDVYRGQGMRLSTAGVRYGEGVPSRRATPLPALALEDELDNLSYDDARTYDRPPSPSAVAIRKIGMLKGREISEEELRRRLNRRQKRAKFQCSPSMSATEIIDSINDHAVADAVAVDVKDIPVSRFP